MCFISKPESYINSVARYSLQFKAERRRVNISLALCAAFIMVSQKSPYTAGYSSCLSAPSVHHTPFKFKNPCVMYKVFTCCFLCGCSTYVWFHLLGLRRGSGCWWWLPSPSPMPRWEFFPVGFRCCPLQSFPYALVLQGLPPWGVVVQGNSGGDNFFCPLSFGSHSHCQLSHPLSCVGGGERERTIIYYYYAQL